MIFFKFPFNDKFYTIAEECEQSAVTFVSFTEDMFVDFQGKIKEINEKDLLENELLTSEIDCKIKNYDAENHDEYVSKITDVIEFIKDENLKKLVIARRKILDYEEQPVSVTKTFLNLCKTYPNAFAYFFKRKSVWMGAFSELLGRFNKNTSEFQTMSLAGTLPVKEEWTEKEIEEQKPVTDYISSILKKYSEIVNQSETQEHISGNIKHLRTDFKAKISSENLEKLISELHPTPAVCGIPKDFCKDAILKFEKYDRELYSGYIKIETEDEIQYFVNLRCAEFSRNKAFFQ